jgi:hypothetical protein
VPHVLPVPALEVGDPIPFLIQMKPDDGLLHVSGASATNTSPAP